MPSRRAAARTSLDTDPDAERALGRTRSAAGLVVEETEGTIGFATQKEVLAVVASWRPADLGVVLLADRFYGTSEMIRYLLN